MPIKNSNENLTLNVMVRVLIKSNRVYDLDRKPLSEYLKEEFGDDYKCSSCNDHNCKSCTFRE